MKTPISHYCQKCLAANPLGQDFCIRCGTRLMIVVEPASARFEISDAGISTDEHLLERISAVENRLSRLTERLERSLDLLLRQAQNSYFDRSLIKTLIGLLSEDGLVETARLEQLWSDRCEKDSIERQESSQRAKLRSKILSAPPPSNPEAFAALVSDAFLLIEDRQTAIAIDKLQRAAEMTDSNSALNLFIGEHFFRNGKTQKARTYLSRAHNSAPHDVGVSLLLGLACADDGDSEMAKYLLANAIKGGGACFAGHYGLGWLLMAENKWRQALTEFKRALKVRPSPEAHYVIASLYYKLHRDALAIRHLLKAVEMDRNYSEAYYLLALLYKRAGKTELAQDAFRQTGSKAVSRGKTRKPVSKKSRKSEPLFDSAMFLHNGLITGVDQRLAAALKEDALHLFQTIESDLG